MINMKKTRLEKTLRPDNAKGHAYFTEEKDSSTNNNSLIISVFKIFKLFGHLCHSVFSHLTLSTFCILPGHAGLPAS